MSSSSNDESKRESRTHKSFADLKASRVSGDETRSAPQPPIATPAIADKVARERVIVRRERKGHGGKAVTIAEGIQLDASKLSALAKDAARALGAGARVEDRALVVQGDQAERLVAWLRA